MDKRTKKFLLKTTGWSLIAVGVYMVYKGTEPEFVINLDKVIDAEFEVIED